MPHTWRLIGAAHRIDGSLLVRQVVPGLDPALLSELAGLAAPVRPRPVSPPVGTALTPVGRDWLLGMTRRYGSNSRFTVQGDGRWYAGLDLAVAQAELGHHLARGFRQDHAPAGSATRCDPHLANISGALCDLRDGPPDLRRAALDPNHYGRSQALGRDLMQAGMKGLLYPSVRAPQGGCVVALQDSVVGPISLLPEVTGVWDGDLVVWRDGVEQGE